MTAPQATSTPSAATAARLDTRSTRPRLLVWDLPVRVFHLVLGVAFIAAFVLANVDDDSPIFSAHMLLGLVLAFMVLLRVVWGFVGTRHARFRDFLYGPRKVVRYLVDAVRGRAERHAGHNPGASVAILAMLVLVLGLALTGVLMARGDKSVEDLHGIFAYLLLATAIIHVVGVLWHSYRQRENLTRGMIDGRKEVDAMQSIPGPRPIAGLVFLALTGLWSWQLAVHFDPATRQLRVPLLGETLQLGELENERHRSPHVRADD